MIQTTPCVPSETKVALLYGGKSSEREISILSAQSTAEGLREQGFEVIEIDTAQPHYIEQLESTAPDVVFNCLHGKGGEDGCVQGVCMELGLPFTGSGVLASALAMDKGKAKVFYTAYGIDTPPSMAVSAAHRPDFSEAKWLCGDKVVVKPACEGSAFGVSIVDNAADYEAAVDAALELDGTAIVERYVAGTEVTVAVIGNDEPEALPVLEIVPHAEFYDFEAKYAQGGSEHICPARIDDEVAKRCQKLSVAAHKVLGCRGVSRSDIIIDGNGDPWVLETNTIPGMTKTSLIPDAARAVGIGFGELCRMIVELALE